MVKRFFFLLFLLILSCLPLTSYGQIGVKLEFKKRAYLQYETVVAKVTLRNDSGNPILFGQDEQLRGDLKFHILDGNKRTVRAKDPDVRILENVMLQPGETQEVFIVLNNYYNIAGLGNYTATAYITHPSLNSDYESSRQNFEVSQGVTEWSKNVGLPSFMLDRDNPEQDDTRTVKIVSLMDYGRKNLYVTVEDKDYVYSVLALGGILGEEKCTAEVDNLGRLHILVPVASKEYRYFVITLNGDVDEEASYVAVNSVPVLARDPQSARVYIVGGDKMELRK